MSALHRQARTASQDRAAARTSRPSLRLWYGLFAIAAFGCLTLLPARTAHAQTPVIDAVTQLLKNAAAAASQVIEPLAFNLAAALATIELVVFAVSWRDDRGTIAFPIRGTAVRGAWWSWIFLLIASYTATPPISLGHFLLDGAEQIASAISGIHGFAPHAVIGQGWSLFLELSEILLDAGIQGFGLFFGAGELGAISILALDLLLILASYYIVALALYLLIFQSLLALAVGPLFFAFGASRWTARLHDSYVTFLFSLSIKIILFAVVLKIGDEVTENLFTLIDLLASLEPTAILHSSIPLSMTLAALSYALGAMLTGPLATRLTAGTFEIASAVLPQRSH